MSNKTSKIDRLHKIEWEQEFWAKGWLKSISKAPLCYQSKTNFSSSSWCVSCRLPLRSHKVDLKKHAESKRHIQNMAVLFKQNKIENFVIPALSKESKVIDIKIAVFIAKHSSLASIDHLSMLLRDCSTNDNAFNKMRLHKTKCASIIKNVVSPSILHQLITELGSSMYSLIVDESTDISQIKWMSVCIKFFNAKCLKVNTHFLGLFLVEEATAEHLYNSLKTFLEKVGLKIDNMIAIGTDGAKNLCGCNKSLFTLLKNDNPDIILIKCICHSLHLCCSKASSEIPQNCDYLIKELYNYFSNSPLRSVLYKRAFDLINTGIDSNNFRKLVQISGTRWLSYGAAVKRVLEQWVELKYHFSLISTVEKDRTAKNIYNELCDEKNRLFLIFINPIINEMNHLNLECQSNYMDAGSMHQKLYTTLLLFARKIFKPYYLSDIDNSDELVSKLKTAIDLESSLLDLENVDFGTQFHTEFNTTILDTSEALSIKKSCFFYLKTLLKEMLNRLPENMNVFKVYEEFSISKCCNSLCQSKFSVVQKELKRFEDPNVPVGVYETQWGKLPFINWNNYLNNDIPKSLHEFWPKVYDYQDAAGTFHFKELSIAVLNMLAVPTSNACVERVFSVMNCIKTKLRNKMQYELLNSLLVLITYMNVNNICCNIFTPTEDMINRFNSKEMYPSKDTNNNNESETDEYEVFDAISDLYAL